MKKKIISLVRPSGPLSSKLEMPRHQLLIDDVIKLLITVNFFISRQKLFLIDSFRIKWEKKRFEILDEKNQLIWENCENCENSAARKWSKIKKKNGILKLNSFSSWNSAEGGEFYWGTAVLTIIKNIECLYMLIILRFADVYKIRDVIRSDFWVIQVPWYQ